MSRILGVRELRKLLPRPGFGLLLDRVEIESREKLTGLKVMTVNEEFFNGHFPNHPIMPGVLQVEAMKQLAELSARPELAKSADEDIHIAKMEKVKFRKPVVPGDRIRVTAELVGETPDSRSYRTRVCIGENVASEATMTLKMRIIPDPVALPPAVCEFDRADEVPMDLKKLKELMPHRYPFLFIDYLAKQDGENMIAIKNITVNDSFFRNAPDNMAVPESILCEMAAQSGCATVLSRPENAGKIGVFMAIEDMESLAPIIPGDQVVIHINLPPSKSRFGKGNGYGEVDGKVVFKIALMFAVVDA